MRINVVVPVGLQSDLKQNKWQECIILALSMSLCSLASIYLNSKSTQFAFKLLSKPESGTRRGELLRACLACKHSTHARNVRKSPKIVVASGGDGRAACRPLCDRHGTERGAFFSAAQLDIYAPCLCMERSTFSFQLSAAANKL